VEAKLYFMSFVWYVTWLRRGTDRFSLKRESECSYDTHTHTHTHTANTNPPTHTRRPHTHTHTRVGDPHGLQDHVIGLNTREGGSGSSPHTPARDTERRRTSAVTVATA